MATAPGGRGSGACPTCCYPGKQGNNLRIEVLGVACFPLEVLLLLPGLTPMTYYCISMT